jgi:hypothetical protein
VADGHNDANPAGPAGQPTQGRNPTVLYLLVGIGILVEIFAASDLRS